MTSGEGGAPWQVAGGALLQRAIGYALGAVEGVTPGLLSNRTPCGNWDLRTLLCHVNDGLAALEEAVATGHVTPDPPADGDAGTPPDPVAAFRDRSHRVLHAWASTGDDRVMTIFDLPLTAGVVAATGALEITVHAWDITHARGHHRHIPHPLALDLLRICPRLVTDDARHALFAPKIATSPAATPDERLVAYLGRPPCPRPDRVRSPADLDRRLSLLVARLGSARGAPPPARDEESG